MDTTQLVRQADSIGYEAIQRGYISPTKPTIKSFSESAWVVIPEGSTEHLYGPCKWPAIHGTTLPAKGAVCIVGFDEQNFPTVLWWEGAQSQAPVAVVNTTGKTSKELDETFTPSPPPIGTIIVDTTNHLYLQRETTKWYKSAALTEVA